MCVCIPGSTYCTKMTHRLSLPPPLSCFAGFADIWHFSHIFLLRNRGILKVWSNFREHGMKRMGNHGSISSAHQLQASLGSSQVLATSQNMLADPAYQSGKLVPVNLSTRSLKTKSRAVNDPSHGYKLRYLFKICLCQYQKPVLKTL